MIHADDLVLDLDQQLGERHGGRPALLGFQRGEGFMPTQPGEPGTHVARSARQAQVDAFPGQKHGALERLGCGLRTKALAPVRQVGHATKRYAAMLRIDVTGQMLRGQCGEARDP